MSDGDSIWLSIALFSCAFPGIYDGAAKFGKIIRTIFANFGVVILQSLK